MSKIAIICAMDKELTYIREHFDAKIVDERNSIQSYKSIATYAGVGITSTVTTLLISEKVGMGYGLISLVISVAAFLLMTPASFKLKERFHGETEESFSIKSMLSYLGIVNLGSESGTSLGTLLADAESRWIQFPHLMLYPAIVISLLMISFNLFGNGLRDAFNPALRGTED